MLDGRWPVLPRHTQPEAYDQTLMEQIRITSHLSSRPRIKSSQLPRRLSQQPSRSRFPDRGYDSSRTEEPAV